MRTNHNFDQQSQWDEDFGIDYEYEQKQERQKLRRQKQRQHNKRAAEAAYNNYNNEYIN